MANGVDPTKSGVSSESSTLSSVSKPVEKNLKPIGQHVTIGDKTYDTGTEEYRKLYSEGNIRPEIRDKETGEATYDFGLLPEFEVSTLSDETRDKRVEEFKKQYHESQNAWKKGTVHEWASKAFEGEKPTPDHLKPVYYKGEYHSPTTVKFHKKHGRFPWQKTFKEAVMDPIHTGLDVAGMTPGVGIIPDLINAGLYGIEGDVENMSYSGAAAIPFAGLFSTPAKYVNKALKPVSKSFSNVGKKLSKNTPNVSTTKPESSVFADGPRRYHNETGMEGIEIANMELDAMKKLGKQLDDEYSYFNYGDFTADNAKFHGVVGGRPVAEVELPTGNTQMFYKSSGLAGKKGIGVGGTTEGLWQPYGGHVNMPNSQFGRGKGFNKQWFIKDGGYKDWYGSKSFKGISDNLDRIAQEGKWDMSDMLRASE